MTQNTNEPTSKLLRLEMIFIFHTEEEMEQEEEEDVTPIEELPRWTVRELEHSFVIQEGIDILKNALARRFSDPWRNYVLEEVAVELPTLSEFPPEDVFEC